MRMPVWREEDDVLRSRPGKAALEPPGAKARMAERHKPGPQEQPTLEANGAKHEGHVIGSPAAAKGLSGERRPPLRPGPLRLELGGEREQGRLVVGPADQLHGERQARRR